MTWKDLRGFLESLDEEGELLHFRDTVDPELEIGAVWTKLTREQGPVALHEQGTVDSYPDWRVTTNVFGTFHRIARSLGVQQNELFPFVSDHISKTVQPELVDDGPVNENEYTDESVDITKQVPNIKWNAKDGGPFITAGHCVLKDPEHGFNTSWYRIQILNSNEIAVRLAPHHQGGVFAERAKKRGVEEMDIAIYVGGDPVAIFGTAAGIPISTDEYDVIGGLRGEPLELVECKTVDLPVPATAELVIEGKIQFDEVVDEGPFGEFCGTYSDSYEEHPVKITRIAHRNDPIFVGTAECKPINETHILQSLFKSVNMKDKLSSLVPEINDVYYPPGSGGFFEAIIQMDSDLMRPGIPKNILYSTVAGDSTAKMFILVDDDVDIQNREEVQWALATRVQSESDIISVPDGITSQLDPSSTEEGVTDKVFIDATKGPDFRGELITIPNQIRERAGDLIEQAKRRH